jgi:hypothetical protein
VVEPSPGVARVDPPAEVLERSAHRLEEVEAALRRLERGSYGRCEQCGVELEDARLEADPLARHCGEHDGRGLSDHGDGGPSDHAIASSDGPGPEALS